MGWLRWFPNTLYILMFCLVSLADGEQTKFLIYLPFSLALVYSCVHVLGYCTFS